MPNYLSLAKNLAVKDAYSEDNLVHYCVSNSHIAILSKILSLEKDHNLEPSLAQKGNDQDNLPLHLLCLNSQANKKELNMML